MAYVRKWGEFLSLSTIFLMISESLVLTHVSWKWALFFIWRRFCFHVLSLYLHENETPVTVLMFRSIFNCDWAVFLLMVYRSPEMLESQQNCCIMWRHWARPSWCPPCSLSWFFYHCKQYTYRTRVIVCMEFDCGSHLSNKHWYAFFSFLLAIVIACLSINDMLQDSGDGGQSIDNSLNAWIR